MFLAVLIGYSFYQLEAQGFFNINQVDIVIKTEASQKGYAQAYLSKLEEALQSEKGHSMVSLSLDRISAKMKNQKWIKNYHVQKDWPSTLKVIIEPQLISLIHVQPTKIVKGKVRPISEEGVFLPEIETQYAPAVPLLKGKITTRDEDVIKKAVELSRSLPLQGSLSQKNLAEINYDKKEGYWIQTTDSPVRIKMGEDGFVMKSLRVGEVLDYLEKKNLKARVIDANLSKKVLVRLQQTP